jgi:membrane protein
MEANQANQANQLPPSRARLRDISGAGWREVGKRVFAHIGEHNLTLVAAGVAFYGIFAIFPALAVLISIYGLVADPADVQQALSTAALPQDITSLLRTQAASFGQAQSGTFGWGVVIGLILTFWSARKGANALSRALDIALGLRSRRSFLRRIEFDLGFTLAAILFAILALIIVVIGPALLAGIDFNPTWHAAISAFRWFVLVVLLACGVTLTYSYAPNRPRPAWRWLVVGASVATVLWVVFSGLFSFYVSHFANYNRIYGAVGSIIVLLLWLFISVLIILLGAELNAAIETQATCAEEAERADPGAAEER